MTFSGPPDLHHYGQWPFGSRLLSAGLGHITAPLWVQKAASFETEGTIGGAVEPHGQA